MPCRYNQFYNTLTMSEHFKIRKNTSLKDIKQMQSTHRLSKDLNSIQPIPIKEQNKKHLLKLVHLEPLKSDASNHQILKKPQFKFQLTQPVNIKASSFNRHECRYDNVCLAPLQTKGELKQKSLDKENRPSSMNQLKYFNMAKMKLTLENTLKYDSSKVFLCLDKKVEPNLDQIKVNQNSKSSKGAVLKPSQSRTRLLKLNQKDLKRITQIQDKYENENKIQKTFRKGIIDQILHKNKAQEQKNQTIDITHEQNSLKNALCSISNETYYNSPFINKDAIFDANCSTIKERQENTSSFISKKAVEQFIQPIESQVEQTQDKTQMQKKRKVDFDKIKKKFPQNFFK